MSLSETRRANELKKVIKQSSESAVFVLKAIARRIDKLEPSGNKNGIGKFLNIGKGCQYLNGFYEGTGAAQEEIWKLITKFTNRQKGDKK